MKSIILGLRAEDGLSGLGSVLSAMVTAGAATEPPSLIANAFQPGLASEALTKVVMGKINGHGVAVLLPSPAFLRFLADEIEKLR